jgi:hypothetical protein
MLGLFRHFVFATLIAGAAVQLVGCGTTRSTDTGRTATEQLLVSDAIDRAVQTVNLRSLAGQTVFFDDSRLGEVVDRNYLISTLRQHLLASGCLLRDQKDQAEFVVEARAGAIGTDRNDLLFGVPSMNVPQIMPLQPVPAAIPEIPIAKRKDQRGIAKIGVFAYHRETGTPVWQSGLVHQESSSNDVWILGAGPFQRGTIYEGTAFAGNALSNDNEEKDRPVPNRLPPVELTRESTFTPPQRLARAPAPAATASEQPVTAVGHVEPQTAVADPTAAPIAPVPPAQVPAPTPTATVELQASPISPQPATPQQAAPVPATASVYERSEPARLPQPRFSSP